MHETERFKFSDIQLSKKLQTQISFTAVSSLVFVLVLVQAMLSALALALALQLALAGCSCKDGAAHSAGWALPAVRPALTLTVTKITAGCTI